MGRRGDRDFGGRINAWRRMDGWMGKRWDGGGIGKRCEGREGRGRRGEDLGNRSFGARINAWRRMDGWMDGWMDGGIGKRWDGGWMGKRWGGKREEGGRRRKGEVREEKQRGNWKDLVWLL